MAVEGQDGRELFDLYEAPESLGVQASAPKPLGRALARSEVHKRGDWHRACHIWVYNRKGEVLLQLRSDAKDTFPGLYDVSVGGHITSGDDSLFTAVKEADEELGLKIAPADLIRLFTVATTARGTTERHGDFYCNEFKDVYATKFDGPASELRAAPGEVAALKWRTWDAIYADLKAERPEYVPRGGAYVEALEAALRPLLKP